MEDVSYEMILSEQIEVTVSVYVRDQCDINTLCTATLLSDGTCITGLKLGVVFCAHKHGDMLSFFLRGNVMILAALFFFFFFSQDSESERCYKYVC